MQTQNFISTPNITGNIGSCKSEVITVIDGRTFFKEYKHDIVTNSCTGIYYDLPQTWGITMSGFFAITLPIIVIVFFISIFSE